MTKPKYTYGDKVRRKTGGPVRTIRDIGPTAYYFYDGTFALIEDQDCYVMVEKHSGFFLVANDLSKAPLGNYLQYGYENRTDFRNALQKLIDWWGGRVGEYVGNRYDHLLLKFHDTPGGRPDQAWLPLYLLEPVPMPDWMKENKKDPIEEELDKAFGFD